jgi:hypothetical protein
VVPRLDAPHRGHSVMQEFIPGDLAHGCINRVLPQMLKASSAVMLRGSLPRVRWMTVDSKGPARGPRSQREGRGNCDHQRVGPIF